MLLEKVFRFRDREGELNKIAYFRTIECNRIFEWIFAIGEIERVIQSDGSENFNHRDNGVGEMLAVIRIVN